MGYILPIQSHAYEQYHKRITYEQQEPYQIEKPYKALKANEYNNHPTHLAKVYAELTEKGKHINVLI